jgi:hypothetical protein
MSNDQRNFKKLLAGLRGLCITAEDLFLSENNRLLVVSCLTGVHPSRGPGQFLDVETLHDKLLQLMEVCHNERDGMWMRSRMEPRFWSRVRVATSWVRGVDQDILRTLALGLTQAAWSHFKNPQRDRHGVPCPWCKLAIAALRVADDVAEYEGHLKQPEEVWDRNFLEFRGPVCLGGGTRLVDRSGRPITQPVFPVAYYDTAVDPLPAGRLSACYDWTNEEPEVFKSLRRV